MSKKMSFNIIFTFFALFTVLESAFGATCTNSTTCVATTYTTGACDATSKVCTCVSGSFPIRTGCGSKLSKPSVKQPAGYSTVVLEGKSATLTCNSPESATEFEWYLNNNLIYGASTSTYTITAASTSNVGPYKCKAKFSGNCNFNSDQSDALEITLFAKTATTLANGPTISLSTQTLFTGKSVTISCVNIPMGYNTAKVAITNSASTLTPFLAIDATNEKTPVKCELTDNPTSHDNKITGATTPLPEIVADIAAPTITSTNAMNSETYAKETPITLKCVPTPDTTYVDTAKTITYAWINGATTLTGETKQTYDIPQTDGNYAIKCQTTYTGSYPSQVITIKRDSTYLLKPTISANPTTPALGSRLTLACGSSSVSGAGYSWKKDNIDIARQFEHTIQLDNLTTSDIGAYVCTAKRSQITQISDAFTVSVSAGHEMVKISMLVLGMTLLMSKVFA